MLPALQQYLLQHPYILESFPALLLEVLFDFPVSVGWHSIHLAGPAEMLLKYPILPCHSLTVQIDLQADLLSGYHRH